MTSPAALDLATFTGNDGRVIYKPNLKLVENSGFKFGSRSKRVVEHAHPDLRDVLTLGLIKSVMDFAVYDGGRTEAEQAEHVRSGASDTMNSRHRIDPINRIHFAVDLVPWINDDVSWNPEHYLPVMRALFYASAQLGVPLDWGGWWKGTSFGRDMPHVALHKKFYAPRTPVSTFRARHRAGHKWVTSPKTGRYVKTKFHGGHPAA